MKGIKYILLFSFALTLLGIVARTLVPFRGGIESFVLGVLILSLLIPIYGILSLVKKQHRIEASMLFISIPLIFAVLFELMNWPFRYEMIIIGSLILFLFSIGILMYSIIKKTKISESILFVTIGFCSLAYCFKVLFWPGSKTLIIAAFITIGVALLITLNKKGEFNVSKIVLGIIILLFTLSFITKKSKLYQNSNINQLSLESNHPEVYYDYAWLLYSEGDIKKAKINLQYAIDELNNPNNEYVNRFSKNRNNYLKTYERAMIMLNNDNWSTLEWVKQQ